MKNSLFILLLIILFSCDNKPVKSQKEILTEITKATVLKAFNAQMAGEIEVMKSQMADEFTFILTGQLDISKTYSWNEFLEFAGYFGSLLKGDVGVEYKGILVDGKTAMVFAEGRMEGIGGKYENNYAIKYTLNDDGKIIEQKEYLSDLLLAQRLYGQDLCGDKRTME
jgi:ketosteroid isomerase-like protein